jgi:neopullulanase
VFAFSRVMPDDHEILIVMNFRNEARQLGIPVDPRSTNFAVLQGSCPSKVKATGAVDVSVPPYGFMVCKSDSWKTGSR